MRDKFNFDEVIKKLKAVKSTVPALLANDTKNYFVKSFNSESWDGKKWKQVDRRVPGTKSYKSSKKSARTSHILVRSGRLRRAVANSLKSATFEKIQFEVNVPYAQVHNDGLRAGRGAGFMMPRRRFMGDTKELRRLQRKRLNDEIKKAFK